MKTSFFFASLYFKCIQDNTSSRAGQQDADGGAPETVVHPHGAQGYDGRDFREDYGIVCVYEIRSRPLALTAAAAAAAVAAAAAAACRTGVVSCGTTKTAISTCQRTCKKLVIFQTEPSSSRVRPFLKSAVEPMHTDAPRLTCVLSREPGATNEDDASAKDSI